jgi:isopentenyl-diphosphate delta-isomerase
MEELILVDENDQEIGVMEKMEAHEKGLLHRAFSVLLFNNEGKLLLQQRALNKYHSPGLWTNTCCSHPRPMETTEAAANRRLFEEMGLHAPLEEVFHFTYRAELEYGLIEHEIDHVFIGYSDETPHLNLEEVMGFKWMSLSDIQSDMRSNPSHYTAWFHLLIKDHYSSIQNALTHESI